jgi:hypothetical protein
MPSLLAVVRPDFFYLCLQVNFKGNIAVLILPSVQKILGDA